MRKCSTILVLAAYALLLMECLVHGIPQLGHYFYGEVVVNKTPAAAGTLIEAKVLGTTLVYSTTVDELGRFGYTSSFRVPGDDLSTPEREGARNGELIEFYWNGERMWLFDASSQSLIGRQIPFESGETTHLRIDNETPTRVCMPLVVSGR